MQVPITPPPQTTILFSGCGCGAGGGDGGGGEEVAAMIGSGIENREWVLGMGGEVGMESAGLQRGIGPALV